MIHKATWLQCWAMKRIEPIENSDQLAPQSDKETLQMHPDMDLFHKSASALNILQPAFDRYFRSWPYHICRPWMAEIFLSKTVTINSWRFVVSQRPSSHHEAFWHSQYTCSMVNINALLAKIFCWKVQPRVKHTDSPRQDINSSDPSGSRVANSDAPLMLKCTCFRVRDFGLILGRPTSTLTPEAATIVTEAKDGVHLRNEL